jgi:hypothetical protein
MYENGKIRHVETIIRSGGGGEGIKVNNGGGEFDQDIV